eukprot:CAMPEP_0185583066 /NCGR_PEP_ID=MMETSP0434-20130131/21298_1 /TAXON_ID=626734 ORGANISM="Favella taraikaensis, Strain Fe Narragansett Bay" /NCGR_SAMPLE_ID=MMETSP0434 /ASSEMBLY_ACC=CAM_ASM_000379 /LENGTH=70 /DNA_ID=CAMNT_0028202057 /DNA_START=12 /DNA_END=224 /DNA_ORIENTATION=+
MSGLGVNQRQARKLLLVGLDNAGKTTLVRRFKKDVQVGQAELIYSTAFLDVEKVTLPFTQTECLVYDLSG